MVINDSVALRIVNSKELRHGFSETLSNSLMRTVEEIRRDRLVELKAEYKSYSRLNDLLQRNSRDSTLSQIANGAPDSKTGKARTMGSDQARKLEEVTHKPRGWMDNDPSLWPFETINPEDFAQLPAVWRGIAEGRVRAVLDEYATQRNTGTDPH